MVLLTLVVLAAAAGTVLAVIALTGGSSKGGSLNGSISGSPTGANGFHMSYPRDWSVVKAPKSPASAGPTVAALGSKDRKGLVVVHAGGAVKKIDDAFIKEVNDHLRAQVPDYRPLKTTIIKIKNLNALFLSYLRQDQGTLVTITVIPIDQRSYVIDTAAPASDKKLAKDIGTIIHSFTLR